MNGFPYKPRTAGLQARFDWSSNSSHRAASRLAPLELTVLLRLKLHTALLPLDTRRLLQAMVLLPRLSPDTEVSNCDNFAAAFAHRSQLELIRSFCSAPPPSMEVSSTHAAAPAASLQLALSSSV